MLPGVPSEMRGMFTDALRPLVVERVRREVADPPVVASRTLRTTGVAESILADRLGELGKGFDDLSLAYLPGMDGVDLRLTLRGRPAAETARRLDEGAARLRAVLGDAIYGQDTESLPALVLEASRRAGVRIAVAESCTGGLLGARITAIPGSSDVFEGGILAYDNRVKREQLDVAAADLEAHGAVSEPVARQMARGVRTRFGTAIGIAITGVAGPGGGTPDKPVGTVWIAIDAALPGRQITEARVFQFVGDRDEIRYRATQSALLSVRRALAADLV